MELLWEDVFINKFKDRPPVSMAFKEKDLRLWQALHQVPPDLVLMEEALNAGADVNMLCDKMKRRPLHHTSSVNAYDAMALLLDYGAVLDVFNDAGISPLHEAVIKEHYDIARELLARGADINARGGVGTEPTPLHSAVFADQNTPGARVAFLLENGADMNEPNGSGRSALDAANPVMADFIKHYFARKKKAHMNSITETVTNGTKTELRPNAYPRLTRRKPDPFKK